MTKDKIIEALKKKGITPPEGATDEDLQKLLDEANTAKPAKPKTVKVRVKDRPISEDGEFREKGNEFETTAERAAALGAFVEVVG